MTRDFTTDELAAVMEQLRLADALAASVEAVGEMERWSMGRDESYDTLDLPIAKWDAIQTALHAYRRPAGPPA
jgi:hypothetical protein